MKGAKAVVECLKEQGIDTIFGYPGGMILPLYDALYDEKRIKNILNFLRREKCFCSSDFARPVFLPTGVALPRLRLWRLERTGGISANRCCG